jgi:hypothetical protein
MTNFNKGDKITVKNQLHLDVVGGSRQRYLYPGAEYEVLQVSTHKVRVAFGLYSIWVDKSEVVLWVSPEIRISSEIESLKDENSIEVNDPRVAWFWKVAAKIADERGFCEEYDVIAKDLGIPGREKDWDITFILSLDNPDHKATLVVSAPNEDEAVAKGRDLFKDGNLTLESVTEYRGY